MGSQKKEAILQAKWAANFVKKSKMGQEWALTFWIALATSFQPSSAAAERVFSILQRFTAQQQSSLEDYIELSVMLQYNLVP